MKTKNDMRGITRLAGIALFLFLVLTLFAFTGGNPVNKNDEKVKKYDSKFFWGFTYFFPDLALKYVS